MADDWKLSGFGSSISLEEMEAMDKAELMEDIDLCTSTMIRPPELLDVFSRTPLTCAIDVWGIGCLVYFLLLCNSPFDKGDLMAQISGQYKRPSRDLDPKWLEMLRRCFVVNPTKRATPEELLKILGTKTSVPRAGMSRIRVANIPAFKKIMRWFKKSTKSWVREAAANNPTPPDQHFVKKIILKAWKKKLKINKFYDSIIGLDFSKTIVTVKALILLYRYISSGPSDVI